MAHCLLSSHPLCPVTSLITSRLVAKRAPSSLHSRATAIRCCNQTIIRRSGNYQPSVWDYDYVQSLSNHYVGEPYERRTKQLKGEVRMMLDKVSQPLDQLELIDVLQRLGVSYHFEEEIERVLKSIYTNEEWKDDDLYATSLKFRLFREHGFHVSQDVFNGFKDKMGNFNECYCNDVKQMLGLYEASYHLKEREDMLEEARDYATRHLEENLKLNIDEHVAMEVSHALELPLHWRMKRLETRWFIDVYKIRQDMNSILLELAVLDFNMVQAIHREDLQNVSRWWRHTRLGEKLSFARDRLVECFFWTVGVKFEPQYGYCRRMSTKVNAMITIIDDIYDVYGTLDELELFIDAIERWDINSMEQLPDYMKICFLALFNSVNEMAYDALKEQDCNIISHLKNSWAALCKCYLLEAKWYHSGYIPTLDEYLNNAWISIAAPVILVHKYFFLTKPITKDALDCLEKYSSVIRWASMILRLTDDLGTSSDELKRGDTPKSIQCYMHETGASEEDARKYIKNLIDDMWKKINKDRFTNHPFSSTFVGTAIDLARMAQCMYQHGDGHGGSISETKARVLALLIEPISL